MYFHVFSGSVLDRWHFGPPFPRSFALRRPSLPRATPRPAGEEKQDVLDSVEGNYEWRFTCTVSWTRLDVCVLFRIGPAMVPATQRSRARLQRSFWRILHRALFPKLGWFIPGGQECPLMLHPNFELLEVGLCTPKSARDGLCVSELFGRWEANVLYLFLYIYICVCVCVYVKRL